MLGGYLFCLRYRKFNVVFRRLEWGFSKNLNVSRSRKKDLKLAHRSLAGLQVSHVFSPVIDQVSQFRKIYISAGSESQEFFHRPRSVYSALTLAYVFYEITTFTARQNF